MLPLNQNPFISSHLASFKTSFDSLTNDGKHELSMWVTKAALQQMPPEEEELNFMAELLDKFKSLKPLVLDF